MNSWVWGALALCTALLVTAAYVPSLANILHMTSPSIEMWVVIVTMSLLPPLIGAMASLGTGRS